MKENGYNAVSITVAYDPDDTLTALRRISMWRRFVSENKDKYTLLASAEDAEQTKTRGKMALGFHFQGTTPFERDISLVEAFYKLGVRHALLAYNQRNHAGNGCHERVDAGLSLFGQELVQEMQRVGMLVDCSHTGTQTSKDIFDIATAPVIYSHSNAAALHKHERNIADDVARACAQTGGVVGVCGVGIFLGDNDGSVDALFRHVDHWVQLLGPQHVGIGMDSVTDMQVMSASVRQDGVKWPQGQNYQIEEMEICRPEQIPELTERMLRAGYREYDVRAVLGENWLRLAREVWKTPA